MNISAVTARLLAATGPGRRFDASIAEAIGWKKKTEVIKQLTGAVSEKYTWYLPNSEDIGRVPLYTANLQAAYELFEQLCPGRNVAVAWGDGYASAKSLNGAEIERAATPAIALCALALRQHFQV